MKSRIAWLVVLMPIMLLSLGAALPEIYFEMKDPPGDDYGYGTYQYPTNVAFQPYQGLFDITEFKVWGEKPGLIYFDTAFAKNTNPWAAPEGFIHQNIRIMVDNIPEHGLTALPQKGAYVGFHPQYGWDYCLKVVGWGNSQLIVNEYGKLKYRPLKTEVLADDRTIRASVPESEIGKPGRNWKYYVLVGSFDGFGEDFFRKVRKERGEWVIGGGLDLDIEPRVMDILAPKSGSQSQIKQLKSFDANSGRLAQLYPVGYELIRPGLFVWFGRCFGILLLVGLAYGIYQLFGRSKRIFWFWVKQPDKPVKTISN